MFTSFKQKAKKEKYKSKLGLPNKYTNTKNLLVTGSTALSGMIVRKGIEYIWKQTTHREPPRNPADRNVSWGEALTWTLLTGVMVSIVHLLIERNVSVEIEENT